MRKFSAKLSACLSFLIVGLVINVSAEPPAPSPYGRNAPFQPRTPQPSSESKIVDQRLLDRVADILSADGDGSENSAQESEGLSIVDSELFERIARIISQNEGQTSPGAPVPQGPAITSDYGVPPEVGSKLLGVNFEIGKPVAARRIAYFQISDDNSLGTGYGANNAYNSPSGSGSRRITFTSNPRISDRIASFAIPDSAPPRGATPGRGYGPP